MEVVKPKFKNGRGYKTPLSPSKDILHPIPLLKGPCDGVVSLSSEEFTSLCPITSQPDWATISIRFSPVDNTLETKSLKLYLHAFRNFESFAESINIKILNDVFITIKPRWLIVSMNWKPRGGIPITTEFARGDTGMPSMSVA